MLVRYRVRLSDDAKNAPSLSCWWFLSMVMITVMALAGGCGLKQVVGLVESLWSLARHVSGGTSTS